MAHSLDTIPSKACGQKLHQTTTQNANQALSSLAVLSCLIALLLAAGHLLLLDPAAASEHRINVYQVWSKGLVKPIHIF